MGWSEELSTCLEKLGLVAYHQLVPGCHWRGHILLQGWGAEVQGVTLLSLSYTQSRAEIFQQEAATHRHAHAHTHRGQS